MPPPLTPSLSTLLRRCHPTCRSRLTRLHKKRLLLRLCRLIKSRSSRHECLSSHRSRGVTPLPTLLRRRHPIRRSRLTRPHIKRSSCSDCVGWEGLLHRDMNVAVRAPGLVLRRGGLGLSGGQCHGLSEFGRTGCSKKHRLQSWSAASSELVSASFSRLSARESYQSAMASISSPLRTASGCRRR